MMSAHARSAILELTAAIAIEPSNDLLYYERARVHSLTGDHVAACADRRQMQRLIADRVKLEAVLAEEEKRRVEEERRVKEEEIRVASLRLRSQSGLDGPAALDVAVRVAELASTAFEHYVRKRYADGACFSFPLSLTTATASD